MSASPEIIALHRQIESLRQARDTATYRNAKLARENETLANECDVARMEMSDLKKQIEELERGKSEIQKSGDALPQAKLIDLQNDLAAVERERELIRTQAANLEIERNQLARELQEFKTRNDQTANGDSIESLKKRIEEQRKQILSLIEKEHKNGRALENEVAVAHEERERAFNELNTALSDLESTRRSSDELRKQIDDSRQRLSDLKDVEEQCASLSGEIAELRELLAALKQHTGSLLQKISSGANIIEAVNEFTDQLPEFKTFVGNNVRCSIGNAFNNFDDEMFTPDLPVESASEDPVFVSSRDRCQPVHKQNSTKLPTPTPAQNSSLETNIETADSLGPMRHDLQQLIRRKNDRILLQSLFTNARNVAARPGMTEFPVFHEMALALENLIRSLHENPERVEQATLRTVTQSIDFLEILLKQSYLDRTKVSESASVLVFSDDPEELDSVLSAMKQVNLQSIGIDDAQNCREAIETRNFDLLLLNIRMPEVSGWDSFSKVHEMPGQKKAPIIFLTEKATIENRVLSSFRGGNDFIAKPFNIWELGVKAFMWAYRSKLELY